MLFTRKRNSVPPDLKLENINIPWETENKFLMPPIVILLVFYVLLHLYIQILKIYSYFTK